MTTIEEMRSRRVALAVAILAWTAIAWGGRIGLLTSVEPAWTWARIGGSVLIGLLAAVALISSRKSFQVRVVGLFLVWTAVLWSRSLVVNWLGGGSLPFKLVHTALAAGFFALAWLAWRTVRAQSSP